jgi:hypothetical protein
MFSRKVVKGKQDRFIFLQAFAGFWEFGLVTGEDLIVGRQSCFASRRQVHFMDLIVTRYLINEGKTEVVVFTLKLNTEPDRISARQIWPKQA